VASRRTIQLGIAAGNIGGLAIYIAGYFAWPPVTAATVQDRLELALWLAAVPAVFTFAVYTSCLRLRDTPGAVDPLAGAESRRFQINQRVLTNTVEQLAIFLPLYVALAVRVDEAHARLLPLHVACWVAARIAFWIGYRRDVAWRSPGMSWTTMIALLTIGWLIRFSI
jgi:hypothetical protein